MARLVARVFARSQIPVTKAKISGEVSVIPLRPVVFGNVYISEAVGEETVGLTL